MKPMGVMRSCNGLFHFSFLFFIGKVRQQSLTLTSVNSIHTIFKTIEIDSNYLVCYNT